MASNEQPNSSGQIYTDYSNDNDDYDSDEYDPADCDDNEYSGGTIPECDSPVDSGDDSDYAHPVTNHNPESPQETPPQQDCVIIPLNISSPSPAGIPVHPVPQKEGEKQEKKKTKKKNKKKKKKPKKANRVANREAEVPADVVDAANYQAYSDEDDEQSSENLEEEDDQDYQRRTLRARRRTPGELALQKAGNKNLPVPNPYRDVPEAVYQMPGQHQGHQQAQYESAVNNQSAGNLAYVPEMPGNAGGMMPVQDMNSYAQGLYQHYLAGTQDCFRPLVMQMMASPLPPGMGIQENRPIPPIFPNGPVKFDHYFEGTDTILVSNDQIELHCHYNLMTSQCWHFPEYPSETGKIIMPYSAKTLLRALQILYGVEDKHFEVWEDEDFVELSNFYISTTAHLIFNHVYLTVQRWTFERQVKYYLRTVDNFPIHKIFLLWMMAAKPEVTIEIIERFYREAGKKREKIPFWDDIFWVAFICYKTADEAMAAERKKNKEKGKEEKKEKVQE